MKHFSDQSFLENIECVPFHVSEIFDDIDDVHWAHNHLLMSVIEHHAPLKTRFVKGKQLPYMNSDLRKAINQRNMWRSRHFRDRRCKIARKRYTTLRNKVVKLQHKSVQLYFDQKCSTQAGYRNFYKVVKPFISYKSSQNNNGRIILREEENIISEPTNVAEIFNMYYSSLAQYDQEYDGLDTTDFAGLIDKHSSHSSVELIKKNMSSGKLFDFSVVSVEIFHKYIDNLDAKKAIGHDGLNAKFLKLCGFHIAKPYCALFNQCVSKSIFPTDMKLAEISPMFKKNDNLDKENYRSVNILTTMSKVFEYILSDQMKMFFSNILNPSLSAYRKGYSCQHVILQLTEYWREALDNNDYVGTMAMDLSKAFDSMPHGLLIAKLRAYGMSKNACNMIVSYLSNRRQRVKISGEVSNWSTINRGVPQGSVLGPLLFNIFLNDLFLVQISGNIANYADDNHLYNKNVCVENLLDDLVNDANAAVTWFHENHMVANPEKFQSIILSRNGGVCTPISVENNDLCPTNEIKVLGVTLDDRLNFKSHVDDICNRASRQINSFKRFSKYLKIDRRLSVYKSFIQSNFSYSPVAWLFCGRKNSNKLEKLQERALRIVFNDFSSSYEFLCERANTLPLSFYQLRFLGIEMYKCIKKTNPTYLNDLFCEQTSDYQLRDSSRLILPRFNTFKFGFKSFRYFGAKLWNVLPADIKQSESLFIFKTRITKWCYSDAAKALEEKMFWLPHYIISTMYLKWCRVYSNFKLGFSLLSACFLPL